MRNHISFIIAMASAILVIGFGLISVGVAEGQANRVGNVGLNLWGNVWFLIGVFLVAVNVVTLAVVIVMYIREQKKVGREMLRIGQKLSVGQALRSPSGRFRLKMQEDGNLVIYLAERAQPMWATNTNGTGSQNYLIMQKDGNLVLYAKDGTALWAAGTEGQGGKRLLMQDDGNLVIYATGERAVWASGSVMF